MVLKEASVYDECGLMVLRCGALGDGIENA